MSQLDLNTDPEGAHSKTGEKRPPFSARLLNRSFWLLYDNLFKGVVINFVLFMPMLAVFMLMLKFRLYADTLALLGVIFSLVMLWHLFAPAYIYYWIKVLRGDEQEETMRDLLLRGFRKFWLKGIIIGLINMTAVMAGVAAINFYKSLMHLGQIISVIGGIGIWIFLMFVMAQIFLLPILVLDEKKRIFTSYKKAFIMLLSVPFGAIFISLMFGYLTLVFYIGIHFLGAHVTPLVQLLGLFPLFLMPFITISWIIIVQVNAAVLVYEKHGVLPDISETWETRGLSNFFKPWETKK